MFLPDVLARGRGRFRPALLRWVCIPNAASGIAVKISISDCQSMEIL